MKSAFRRILVQSHTFKDRGNPGVFTLCLMMLTRSAQFYEKIFGFR